MRRRSTGVETPSQAGGFFSDLRDRRRDLGREPFERPLCRLFPAGVYRICAGDQHEGNGFGIGIKGRNRTAMAFSGGQSAAARIQSAGGRVQIR